MKRFSFSLIVWVAVGLGLSLRGWAEPPPFFRQFCFDCHGEKKAKGHFNFERLATEPSVGPHAEAWEKVVEMLEKGEMPPEEAERQPDADERKAAAAWVRSTLQEYERVHSGEPGHVTVRRLTSGEYAYAIRDLTGIDIKTSIDASGDSVGGEGFINFGDVQFVQDTSIERYLEAAKAVADHAMIGAGPLFFHGDIGRTGLELSALNRINELYASKGFRVVSGEGGRPFGLERYGKAFFAAWTFKHRAILGRPSVTLRDLAAAEGITGRFAEHVASVVERSNLGYPAREMVEQWRALPVPGGVDDRASIAQARNECDKLAKHLTTWPSWFFGRGDLAAGGAGDESPLVFDDKSLAVEATHKFTYPLGFRFGRGAVPLAATNGPYKLVLNFADINPTASARPVVLWRNAQVIIRARPARGTNEIGTNAAAAAVVSGTRRRLPQGPILERKKLRTVLDHEAAAALAFGTSPDGSTMGQDDFATTNSVSFVLPAVAPGTTSELDVEAELGADRDAVVRLVVSEGEAVPARGSRTRAFLGDSTSAGYRTFRAGIAEYVSLLPPSSHGEANPADKDPVPAPFDNTYNSPEHDAFVMKVKYQRTDAFFRESMVDGAERKRLDEAWHDLLGSWPYHDAYLGLLAEHYGVKLQSAERKAQGAERGGGVRSGEEVRSLRIQDMDAAHISRLPLEMRPMVASLRAHYDEVKAAFARAEPGHLEQTLDFASRAWRRPLAPDEKARLKNFYHRARSEQALEHDDAVRALLARILVSPEFLYRVETVSSPESAMRGTLKGEHQTPALGSKQTPQPAPPHEPSSERAVSLSPPRGEGQGEGSVRSFHGWSTGTKREVLSTNYLPGAERESPGSRGSQPLNDWELASRLSFFLWSSVPDDELRRAAEAGELGQAPLLARQVRRMTADPKARRLATEFFGQWLGFYRFDEFRGVDTGRFPEFTDEVRSAMYDEAVSTFEYLVRHGRPLREVLHADYAFLNAALAKFYGVPQKTDTSAGLEQSGKWKAKSGDKEGSAKELPATENVALKRVDNANAFNRGGALRLGAVLTTTSPPLRTSPVKRGDWVLRRILGTPTPPPPGDAGTLPGDPKAFGGLSLREKLTEHKQNPVCANCHVRIDPLGFPLEGFDPVGRARKTYDDGVSVDLTGEFSDKSTIVGPDGLLRYLRAREPQVMKTLAKKMVGYALGRTVLASDRTLIDEMTALGGDATFAELAIKIANSRQFRHREGADGSVNR
jgi:hypothetical protein